MADQPKLTGWPLVKHLAGKAWKYTVGHPVFRCFVYAALTHITYTLHWFKWWVPLLPLVALFVSAAEAHYRLQQFQKPATISEPVPK